MQTAHPDGSTIVVKPDSADTRVVTRTAARADHFGDRQLAHINQQLLSSHDQRMLARFPDQKTALMQWILCYQYALDLFRCNAVLLWFLVCIAEFEEWSEADKIEVLKKPQRTILDVLTAVNSKSAVRFVSRLEATRFGSED